MAISPYPVLDGQVTPIISALYVLASYCGRVLQLSSYAGSLGTNSLINIEAQLDYELSQFSRFMLFSLPKAPHHNLGGLSTACADHPWLDLAMDRFLIFKLITKRGPSALSSLARPPTAYTAQSIIPWKWCTCCTYGRVLTMFFLLVRQVHWPPHALPAPHFHAISDRTSFQEESRGNSNARSVLGC
ncbi:hypothetical protein BDV59DRAFT_47945 [Aspergillus ambiguus]|uniref:uncharacterized protein n=1 Tax=Aspergillus ambiguus TaxID=176160 RepID=UPI003CCC8F4E